MKTYQSTAPDGFVHGSDHPRATDHARLDEYLSDPKQSTLPADSAKFEKTEQLSLPSSAFELLFGEQHLDVPFQFPAVSRGQVAIRRTTVLDDPPPYQRKGSGLQVLSSSAFPHCRNQE